MTPITVSVLIGVPCIIAVYCFIKAVKQSFKKKKNTTTMQRKEGFDIYDDDEDWHLKTKPVWHAKIDLPDISKKYKTKTVINKTRITAQTSK